MLLSNHALGYRWHNFHSVHFMKAITVSTMNNVINRTLY